MGHALDESMQDAIIRFSAAGILHALGSGTDHAGIATQIKLREALRKRKGYR